MKKRICFFLALALLLSGCSVAAGAEAVSTGAPTESAAPAPETAAPTEPAVDAGLSGTVMELPDELTVSADAPRAVFTVRFPKMDLTGAPAGRRCSLTVSRDGAEVLAVPDLVLLPGVEQRVVIPIPFTRYMPAQTSLTVRLQYGEESLERELPVTLENFSDEIYAARTGDRRPYSISVLHNQNVVIVYGKDDTGAYTMPVKVFVCSTGRWTPSGAYTLGWKAPWRALFGGVYGQYACHITGNILFHSVPYFYRDKGTLETEEYNKLGTTASMGCVRLAVQDVKWIYDNCPTGTMVRIYNTDTLPVEKPEPIHIDPDSPYAGWDPTDPDPENPWNS